MVAVVGIGVPSYRDGPKGIQHPERLDVGGMGGLARKSVLTGVPSV